MNLIKTGTLNFLSLSFRILSLLGINKILAIYVGPAGYALIGQFQSFTNFFTILLGGIFGNSVIKVTASSTETELKVSFWGAVGSLGVMLALCQFLLIAFYADVLSKHFFGDASNSHLIILYSAFLVFSIFSTIIQSVANGYGHIKELILGNISVTFLNALFISLAAIYWGVTGVFFAISLLQCVSFLVFVYTFRKYWWSNLRLFFSGITRESIETVSKYAIMALVSALTVPFTQLILRTETYELFGQNEAGLLEASWRLSSGYMMLITSTISLYYLPRFSSLGNAVAIKNEFSRFFLIGLPLVSLMMFGIFFLKSQIVELLFDTEFSKIADWIFYVLLSDFFKSIVYLYGVLLIAKGLVRTYIVLELLHCALVVCSSNLYLADVGVKSIFISFTFSNIVYISLVVLLLTSHRYKKYLEA